MGVFDYIRCKYPLPAKDMQDYPFQTKDTPDPMYLEQYEIREDGSLWFEDYDVEDRSDPNAEGLMRLRGMATRVNKRWKKMDQFTGEIVFYGGDPWYEFSAYFVNGELQSLIQLSPKPPRA